MSAPDWQRAHLCAERFGISRHTLQRWAEQGLIGRSTVDRLTFYDAASITRLIDQHARTERKAAPQGGSWKSHPMFSRRAS